MKRNSNSEATFREPAVGASRQRAQNELVLELRITLKYPAEIHSLPALRVSSEQRMAAEGFGSIRSIHVN
jgi:hypothetical protein